MKKKDIAIIIGFVAAVVVFFGILIAWNDGYLEGTLLAKILGILFPAFVVGGVLMQTTSYWIKKIYGSISGKTMVLIFLLFALITCLLLILPVPHNLLLFLVLAGLVYVMITLIVFAITGR